MKPERIFLLTLVFFFCRLLPADQSGNNLLGGTYVDLDDGSLAGESDIAPALQSYHSLGIDLIIVAHSAVSVPLGAKAPGRYCPDLAFRTTANLQAKLTSLMTNAQRYGMKVVVGLASSMGSCEDFQKDATLRQQTWTANIALVRQIEGWLGTRFGATFEGYYIPDEVSAPLLAFAGTWDYIQHTERQASWTRTTVQQIYYPYSPPVRKIYVSPYLGRVDQFNVTPDDVGYGASIFKAFTGVDVLLYQDSVRAFDFPLTGSRRLEVFSEALHRYVPSGLRMITEIFDYHSSDGSAPIVGVNQQLWQSRHCERPVAFIGPLNLFYRNVFDAHPGAVRLYNDYKRLYGFR